MSYYNMYPLLPKHIKVSTLKTLSGENPALVSPSGLKIFCRLGWGCFSPLFVIAWDFEVHPGCSVPFRHLKDWLLWCRPTGRLCRKDQSPCGYKVEIYFYWGFVATNYVTNRHTVWVELRAIPSLETLCFPV